ncbi:MAG: SpoIVB peptidase, partial [Chitinophagales bacterium]
FGRLLLVFLALGISGWLLVEWSVGLPAEVHLAQGRTYAFDLRLPVSVSVPPRARPAVRVSRGEGESSALAGLASSGGRTVVLHPERLGRTRLNLRLFGFIPLRGREVTVLPEVRVVPGGQAIGVLVAPQGMIVTGFSPVQAAGGAVDPARQAGLKVGDLITRVDGEPVYSATQLEALVNAGKGRPVRLEVRRGASRLEVTVSPAQVAAGQDRPEAGRRAGRWRLGVYVEDPAAGVGTLSFWDPESKVYGALGHMITDSLSRRGVALHNGRIVPAVIAGIQPGRRGQPGEKIGLFHHTQGVLGTIERNTFCGIFGRMMRPPGSASATLPIAAREEIHTGPAEMRTVVRQQRIEAFQIEIVRVRRTDEPAGKGLVIRVTDPRLLARAGGIVQGMSGSPIIQDGRLVGVVTHVFVNDPTRGYGLLAEWMAMEAGLFRKAQSKKGESQAS